jgi:hypothetical protein
LLPFAKRVGNLAPEEVVGVVATVEGSDVGCLEVLGIGKTPTILLAQYGMLRQQAETDEQMRLTAAHGLLEVKDTLGRNTSEPGHALADKVLHALSDVGFLEELGAVVFRSDQFVELLDLVAKLDGQRIGLKLAGITDGLHMRASWHLAMVQALVRLAKQSIWPSLGQIEKLYVLSADTPWEHEPFFHTPASQYVCNQLPPFTTVVPAMDYYPGS